VLFVLCMAFFTMFSELLSVRDNVYFTKLTSMLYFTFDAAKQLLVCVLNKIMFNLSEWRLSENDGSM
jgi:hypothetical protein